MNKIEIFDQFEKRHIGINKAEAEVMLKLVGAESLEQLIDETIPAGIRAKQSLDLPEALTEYEYLKTLKEIAQKNKVYRSYIGMGYNGTITPNVIARNIFHNPGWYTQYTPYQAEIAQGRLEALLNFQTMVSDLTGLPIANASLLDEGTAAAEAMSMFFDAKNKRNKGQLKDVFLVSDEVLPQTIAVLETRAEPLDIKIKVQPVDSFDFEDQVFGILLQYPGKSGIVENYQSIAAKAKENEVFVTVAADILSLALLVPPGEWGADAVVGNTQRLGVPMGYGGPHAAYFATLEKFKRQIPGRIIGVSQDMHGKRGLRMALQTREQHIKREKATSNICTAQALLAIMSGMYATYHGPDGIKAIAERIHFLTVLLNQSLASIGYQQLNNSFFDTLNIRVTEVEKVKVKSRSLEHQINFHYTEDSVQISLDETVSLQDINDIVTVFSEAKGIEASKIKINESIPKQLSTDLQRTSTYLTHPIFNSYHTETKMMRYIKSLENKDLSLTHSMIPLGSCTMKLNAATQLMPVSWDEFANIHPFAPLSQTKGYQQIFSELEEYLSEITGFAACSLQPNSGAQGEYAGLLTIRAYHLANGDSHRNVALIPSSAHGTNPASAVMAGMKVVVVKCDDQGNIDVDDLTAKATEHAANLSALMVTYPSTHGVFETRIKEICEIIHENGGKVYMDGANMNAQVGLTSPGLINADVCHLNLHKTFSIPHGGGGPGMGPICVNESLKPFLPKHPLVDIGGEHGINAVSAAPWGSSSILLISYAYIRMLGVEGVTNSTKYAILNANYIKNRLQDHYNVLFVGENGRSAHELIIDIRPFKSIANAEDVAKRLIDYGFHAPTLSWPVPNTMMIEPTESESIDELDRFCDAMIQIKAEIDEIATGQADATDNVLKNAPHTLERVTASEWSHAYSREQAAYPLPYLRKTGKFWPSIGRVNNAYGDRNLVCTCPPIEAYE